MITVFERSYKIDKDAALQEYGRTTQAGGVSPIIQGNENKLTNGAIPAKFLETVDGDVCGVECRHSKQYEEVKLGECGLTHSRVYPVEHYTCAFACLPFNLRVLALHSDYYAFDLSKCFHYIALGLTKNEESKRVLTEFLTNWCDRMQQIAEFYGKDLDTAKTWFHAFSNCKQKENWLEENKLESTHEFIDRWIAVRNSYTAEFCKLYPKAFKALGRQKSTLRSYLNQCEEAKARAAMEAHFSNGLGQPMHGGISVLKHGLEEP